MSTIIKIVPEWLATTKMLQDLDNALFFNNDIVFFDADSDKFTFFLDDMSLFNVDLNNVNLDDNNFDDYDPETTLHVRLMAWCNRYKQ